MLFQAEVTHAKSWWNFMLAMIKLVPTQHNVVEMWNLLDSIGNPLWEDVNTAILTEVT